MADAVRRLVVWLRRRAPWSVRVARRTFDALQPIFTRREVDRFRRTGVTSGGRIAGAPSLLLTTTGCRSGLPRTTPLVYVREGDDVMVVAAAGGAPWHPRWLGNLRQDPAVEVDLGDGPERWIARVVEPEERATAWPRLIASIATLEGAQARTDRTIELVHLTRAQPPPRSARG